jgi:hypothetical protein
MIRHYRDGLLIPFAPTNLTVIPVNTYVFVLCAISLILRNHGIHVKETDIDKGIS